MKNRSIEPNAVHLAFKHEISNLLQKYSIEKNLSPCEILAVTAQILGMIIALQDQRTMTVNNAIKIIRSNIKAGNETAIMQLQEPAGQA